MHEKKILIVSNAFFPENSPRSFRTTELAKEFARQGHQVTVITHAHPEQENIRQQFGIRIKDLGRPNWKPIPLKGSGPALLARRLLARFSGLLFEYPNIQLINMIGKALRGESGYDLLISIAAPHPVHWGVARALPNDRSITKVWVADCGDPYMGQENDTFKAPFYFGYVEKWFCRRADYLTVPTQGAIAAYYPEFHEKIRVIPQGFRFEDVKRSDEKSNTGKPIFAYAGHLIPGRRDPSEFLEYLVNADVDFEFHVYTSTQQLVAPFLDRARGRVILHDPIPRSELLYQLSKMDFVVNFENVGAKQTPSKLIDYAIIDKPIISIKTGALQADTVDKFLVGNYEDRYVITDPDRYRIENVCGQFLALLEKS